jgi:small subunit ribosomal protein S16
MATRIRLARGGSKKKPFYRLVVTDKRSPRDGNFIEKLGTYNPILASDNKERFQFNKERVEYWLKTGASPSEKVAIFLWDNGFKSVEKYLPAAFPKSKDEREKIKSDKLEAAKKEAEAKAQKEAEEAKKAEEEALAKEQEAQKAAEQEENKTEEGEKTEAAN